MGSNESTPETPETSEASEASDASDEELPEDDVDVEVERSAPVNGNDPKERLRSDVNGNLWEAVDILKRKGFTRVWNRSGLSMDLEDACDMVLPLLESTKDNSDSEQEPKDLDLLDSIANSNLLSMKRQLEEKDCIIETLKEEKDSIIEALKEENRVLVQRVGSLETAVKAAQRREVAAADRMALERKAKEELRAMHQVKDLELLRKIKRFNTSLEVDLMPWSLKSRSPSDGSLDSLATPKQIPSSRKAATLVTLDRAASASTDAKRRTDLNDRTDAEPVRKTNEDRATKIKTRNSSDNAARNGSGNGSKNGSPNGSQVVSSNDSIARDAKMDVAETVSSLQLLPLDWCSSEFNLEEELARTLYEKVKDCTTKVKDCPAKANDSFTKVTAENQPKISSNGFCSPVKATGRHVKVTQGHAKDKSSSSEVEKYPSKVKTTLEFNPDEPNSSGGFRHVDMATADTEETAMVGRMGLGQRWSASTGEQRSTHDYVRSFVGNNCQMTSWSACPMTCCSYEATPSSETPPIFQAMPRCDAAHSMALSSAEEATPSSETTPSSEVRPIYKATSFSESTPAYVTTPTSETALSSKATPIYEATPSSETTPCTGNVINSDNAYTSLTEGNHRTGKVVTCLGVAPGRAGKSVKTFNRMDVTNKSSSSGVRSRPREPTAPASIRPPKTDRVGTLKTAPHLANAATKATPRRTDFVLYSRLPKSTVNRPDASDGPCPVRRTAKNPQSPTKPQREVPASPSLSYTKQTCKDCPSHIVKNTDRCLTAKPPNRDDDMISPRSNEHERTTAYLDVPASEAGPSSSFKVPRHFSGEELREVNQPELVVLPPSSKLKLPYQSTIERNAKRTQLRKDDVISPRVTSAKNSAKERSTVTRNATKPRLGT